MAVCIAELSKFYKYSSWEAINCSNLSSACLVLSYSHSDVYNTNTNTNYSARLGLSTYYWHPDFGPISTTRIQRHGQVQTSRSEKFFMLMHSMPRPPDRVSILCRAVVGKRKHAALRETAAERQMLSNTGRHRATKEVCKPLSICRCRFAQVHYKSLVRKLGVPTDAR